MNTLLKSVSIILGLLVGGWMVMFFVLRDSNTVTGVASVASGIPVTEDPGLSGHIIPEELDKELPIPDGYLEYRNTKYNFSFHHSPQGVIHEYDEGNGVMTITLENKEKVRGMQIFILPYSEPTISEERFKKDVPSGVRTDVANTSVDGVRAVTFKSRDMLLGDTREIWFIRGGYLYEVTALTNTAAWFAPIISSWRFI